MHLDPKPFFRRIIPPWYDTDAVCYTLIALMALSLLFGIQGVSVALQHPAFADHVWVPVLLILLSLYVMISAALRLLQRRRNSHR